MSSKNDEVPQDGVVKEEQPTPMDEEDLPLSLRAKVKKEPKATETSTEAKASDDKSNVQSKLDDMGLGSDSEDMPLTSRRKKLSLGKKTAANQESTPMEVEKKAETPKRGVKRKANTADSDSEDDTLYVKKKAAPAKKTTKAPATKKVKKEESEDEKPATKAKATVKKETIKKETATKKETTTKTTPKKETPKKATTDPEKLKKEEERKKKREEKEKKDKEEEENRYKWWLEDKKAGDDKVKWNFLQHCGVQFPPEYEPHGVQILYKGKPVTLTPEQEEVATMFAVLKESNYYTKDIFRKNFWDSWVKLLNPKDSKTKHVVKDLNSCDFTPIWDWYCAKKEAQKNKTKEEKKAEKEAKDKVEEKYKWAMIDGRKEKVGNFRIEPPGLFRGRGEHPLQGCLKKRVKPEDVIINCSKDSVFPAPPPGHKWKEIVHNNEVTWLATYASGVKSNKETKYVFLAASSSFKGKSDLKKFETAKLLGKHIDGIRVKYNKLLVSDDTKEKQLGTALYFIDKLALRVGNEKGADEADTVGCCSLRVEHVKVFEEEGESLLNEGKGKGKGKKGTKKMMHFKFLGKDSIEYDNTVEVTGTIFNNVKAFIKGKKKADSLFDHINATVLNNYLKKCEPVKKLSAKVFRTYNASFTLEKQLQSKVEKYEAKHGKKFKDLTVHDKLRKYNKANKEVALLCNHQRAVPKTFAKSMVVLGQKIQDKKDYIEALLKLKQDAKNKDYDALKEKWQARETEKFAEYEEEKKNLDDAKAAAKAAKQPIPEEAVPLKKPTKWVVPAKDKIDDKVHKVKDEVAKLETEKKTKTENAHVALGTSKINYLDPRITVAFCKGQDIPINKLFSKTLMDKFPWAMDVDQDYSFCRFDEADNENDSDSEEE